MTNIEQLKKETNEIKKNLEELKNNVSLSEVEKKNKAESLKNQAETTKKKIENEIHSLENKTDDESKKKKEEAETLLNTFNETMSLYSSILNNGNTIAEVAPLTTTSETTTPPATTESPAEEKGFFGKTGEWVGNQWSDVRSGEKWKEEPGKNTLRLLGFGVTGYAAYKGVKALWNRAFGNKKENTDENNVEDTETKSKKAKEEKTDENSAEETETKPEKKKKKKDNDEDSSWRKKFFWGSAAVVGTAVGGVQVYKHWNKIKGRFKDILGTNMPFDEARKSVEAQVYAGINKDSAFGAFNADFKGITYDETTQMVSSYGEKTKIDYKNKKIDGLSVEFPDWEQLLHAVNLVNFAKRNLQGRGETEKPFNIGRIDGDLSFDAHGQGNEDFVTGSASNFWTILLGTTGAVSGGLLGGYLGGLTGAGMGAVAGGTTGYVTGSAVDENSTLRKMCDTLKTNPNLGLFANYLNDIKDSQGKSLWKYKNQKVEQQNKTPLQKYINKLITELNNDYYEEGDNGIRNLKAEMDKNNPEKFWVSSYNGANDNGNNKVCITLKGCKAKQGDVGIDFTTISYIHIEKYQKSDLGNGLNIKFPNTEAGLKEAIRTVNLTNKIRFHYKKNCAEKYPFAYGKYRAHGFLQFQKNALDVDTPGDGGDTIVFHDELEKQYPTIAEDLEEYGTMSGWWNATFNNDKEQSWMAKNAQNGTPESKKGSKYIRYLHQMRVDENGDGNFRLKKNR